MTKDQAEFWVSILYGRVEPLKPASRGFGVCVKRYRDGDKYWKILEDNHDAFREAIDVILQERENDF